VSGSRLIFHAIIGPMNNLYILLMLMAGAGVAVQIVINAQLRVVSASALWATNISFAVSMAAGLVALAFATAFTRAPLPDPALWRAPSWVWLGGLGGAVYVLLAVLLARRLGAALLSAVGILGQLVASILIDTTGGSGRPCTGSLPRVLSASRCSPSASRSSAGSRQKRVGQKSKVKGQITSWTEFAF
jgi:transporter family-2 protein